LLLRFHLRHGRFEERGVASARVDLRKELGALVHAGAGLDEKIF